MKQYGNSNTRLILSEKATKLYNDSTYDIFENENDVEDDNGNIIDTTYTYYVYDGPKSPINLVFGNATAEEVNSFFEYQYDEIMADEEDEEDE